MFESAKRAAGNMVGRAAWEADKSQRVNAQQHELDLLNRERQALLDQVAAVLVDLQRKGQVTQPSLKAVAERLTAMQDEMRRAQASIEAIRSEAYQPGAVSFGVQRNTPDANSVPAPRNISAPAAPTAGGMVPCPRCGQMQNVNAAFCSTCGSRMR